MISFTSMCCAASDKSNVAQCGKMPAAGAKSLCLFILASLLNRGTTSN